MPTPRGPLASGPFDTPVLLVAFNRPDLTRIVLDRIREIEPVALWVAVDGPRNDVHQDGPLVEEVRAIIDDEIDWHCKVSRLYHTQNQGCPLTVSGAVSWFLGQSGRGIILEDDCLPDLTFFAYAAALLEYYANEPDVMHIGGENYLAAGQRPWSYYFTRYNRIWGWATWARAWAHFDITLSSWPAVKAARAHQQHLPIDAERILWERRWDTICDGKGDVWEHAWFLARLLHGRAIAPTVNLVSNIGFRHDALHTKDPQSEVAGRATQPMRFPLVHPPTRDPDVELDRQAYEKFIRPWVTGPS